MINLIHKTFKLPEQTQINISFFWLHYNSILRKKLALKIGEIEKDYYYMQHGGGGDYNVKRKQKEK